MPNWFEPNRSAPLRNLGETDQLERVGRTRQQARRTASKGSERVQYDRSGLGDWRCSAAASTRAALRRLSPIFAEAAFCRPAFGLRRDVSESLAPALVLSADRSSAALHGDTAKAPGCAKLVVVSAPRELSSDRPPCRRVRKLAGWDQDSRTESMPTMHDDGRRRRSLVAPALVRRAAGEFTPIGTGS